MQFLTFSILAASALASTTTTTTKPWSINGNGDVVCEKIGTFCAGDSGKTNIIIHCQEVGSIGNYAGNCNDNLAGACGGVCQFAPCKQGCPDEGYAGCSLDGAVAPNGTVLHGQKAASDMTKRAFSGQLYAA